MRALRAAHDKLEEAVMIGLLMAICGAMIAQVVARYIFNSSMSWPEEFCRYCYIWTMFLSLGYTIRRGTMLRVGVVMDLLPTAVQSVVRVLVRVAMIAMFAALLRQSVTATLNIKNITKEISSAMQVPMWLMYMAAVIGFALALIRSAEALVGDVRSFGARQMSTIEATRAEAEAEAEIASEHEGGEV